MDHRNFVFMFYGFTLAWLIIFMYVLSLIRRAGRIRAELRRYEASLGVPKCGPPQHKHPVEDGE
jgi:CcmD family protein